MDILHDGETLEDLQRDSLVLIQKKEGFRFGTDAVLLSDFSSEVRGKVLDLCTGSGVVAVLLSAKSAADDIYGLEIQPELADMACRSVLLNRLDGRIHITCGDLKDAGRIYPMHSFDAVTCNPPYMRADTNVRNDTDALTAARHEVMCTLDDVVKTASDMLKYRGKFFMVHRPSRMADIFHAFEAHKISPKQIRIVYPFADKPPVMLLIEGAYMGGKELKVMPPLILRNADGSESAELCAIYGKNKA